MLKIGRDLWISPDVVRYKPIEVVRLKLQTFVARVVQVGKVRLPVRWQGRDINSVPMVLAGDVAAAGTQVKSRDVVSTVAVLELDRTRTSGQSQQLVAQTDAEDGDLRRFHQAAQMVGRLLAVGWVTRAIGDEYTIKMVGDLVDRVVEGEHCDASSTVDEATQNVLLDTAVEDGHMELRVAVGHMERRLRAHLADKVDLLWIGEGLILVGIVFFTDRDTSQGRALFPKVGDNGTGIDA